MVTDEVQVRERPVESPLATAGSALAWPRAVGLAWVIGLPIAVALEPVPTQPDAIPTVLSTVLSFVLFGLLGLAAAGLIRGARWGYAASAGAAFMLTGMSVACPVSGHHAMGLWWVGQAGVAVGLMALSLAGWQRASAVS